MLYIVGSPIGNLKDITLRAIEILNDCDLVLCENPQRTLKLINKLKDQGLIEKKKIVLNFRKTKNLVEILKEKKVAFLVSSGMPGISDPSSELIKLCQENNIYFDCAPGVSALTCAISLLPFQVRIFVFLGFLPKKQNKIKKIFKYFLKKKITIIFFESPYRILKTLNYIKDVIEENNFKADFYIFKEITKINQKYYFGKINEIIDTLKKEIIKGEWTIVIKSYGVK
jgi:16S rRNA (cytidine1402-2'-O)-methyltransferase